MTGPAKAKGDRAEREAASILSGLLGPIRRKLGAGRQDDCGDLEGIPSTVVQVCDWTDVTRAVRSKPLEAEVQRGHANATFAFTMVRLRGGVWRCVLTPEQMATYVRETLC